MNKETYDNLPFDTRFMVDMMLNTIFNEAVKQIFSTHPYKARLEFVKPFELKIEAVNSALEKLNHPVYGTDVIFERILRKTKQKRRITNMDKQQLYDFTTTETEDVSNEQPEELTPDEVEEALEQLKQDKRKHIDKVMVQLWSNILEIRYTRKYYKAKKHALKHQPNFTYVDLDALTILFVSLAIIDVVSLVTKLLGWW